MLKEKLKMMNGVLENGNYQLGQFAFVERSGTMKAPVGLLSDRTPFLPHKTYCEVGGGLPGSRKKMFIALPDTALSGARTTRPAGSQGRSGWTG